MREVGRGHPMHDVVPTVVTIDVRITMITSTIVFQSGFFIFDVWSLKFFVGKDNLGQLRTTFSGCREAGLTGEWKSCPMLSDVVFVKWGVWSEVRPVGARQEILHSCPIGRACSRSVVLMQASHNSRLIAAFTFHFSLPTLFTFICKGTTICVYYKISAPVFTDFHNSHFTLLQCMILPDVKFKLYSAKYHILRF